MGTFAIGVACLLALAAWMLRASWRPTHDRDVPLAPVRVAHLEILREQLATLDGELAAGEIDAQLHRIARTEVQRRVLDEATEEGPSLGGSGSPMLAVGLAIGVAAFSLALYAAIGNPGGLVAPPSPEATTAPTAPEGDVSPAALQAMLASLAQRLAHPSDDPASDLQGWTMLARSYATLQRFPEADAAYARAIALAPRDAQLRADRADVLAMVQGQRTDGEPDRLIAEALRLDPRNLKALALAGGAAFERKDFVAARDYWQRARRLAPEGSEFATELDRSLVAAGATADSSSAPQAEAAPARITGQVSLAPALAAQVLPSDTVFVFARAAEGSRMPLAIIRRTVADLPLAFTLDDSLAMSAQTRLSGATRVIVGARISRSGNAMPRSGDLHGESAEVSVRVSDLQLVIDRVEP